jgi:hypothetical protein
MEIRSKEIKNIRCTINVFKAREGAYGFYLIVGEIARRELKIH